MWKRSTPGREKEDPHEELKSKQLQALFERAVRLHSPAAHGSCDTAGPGAATSLRNSEDRAEAVGDRRGRGSAGPQAIWEQAWPDSLAAWSPPRPR